MAGEQDPFEQSLRELLRDSGRAPNEHAAIERVLKTANRQIGVGALFALLGRGFFAVLLGLNSAAPHLKPVSRLNRQNANPTSQQGK